MHKQVGAVENAIAVLNLLAISRQGLRLLDISRRLNINNSTCLSILRTLARHNAVIVDARTKRYSIGGYVAYLQNLIDSRDDTERVGFELMAEMARTYDVVGTIWTRADERTLALTSVFESGGEMSISMRLGLTRPIYFGSIGRLFAAVSDVSDEELRAACATYNWQSPPAIEDYLESVREARERGWAVDNGNAVRGMASISVPLIGDDGTVERCCSAGMLEAIYENTELREKVLNALLNIQKVMSRNSL